jgi:hypothetical protein
VAPGIDDERWRAEVYVRHADEAHWPLRLAVVEAELRACGVAVGVTGSTGGRRPSCSPAVCRTPFAATVMGHHADPRVLRRYQEVVDEHKQDAATRMDTLLGGTRGRER